MKSVKAIWGLFAALALSLTACNISINGASTALSPKDQAATIVAMTLGASGQPTSEGVVASTPFASPVAQATATVTATSATAILHINTNVNCRSGPGGSFDVVTSYTAGTTLNLAGKSSNPDYWQVKIPNSSETCWIDAQYSTPEGDTASLPEATSQTGNPSVPAKPSALYYNYTCNPTTTTTSLSWNDSANNENGYYVYRQGSQIADLPANSTTYTDTVNVSPGTQLTYSVEAYNNAGVSDKRTVTFTCQ